MARVTGIGGVFFKASGAGKDLAAGYEKNLGMQRDDFGGVILNWQDDTAEDKGMTVWHTADGDSTWFSPSESAFMINYRVDDLAALIAQLEANGVAIQQGPEYHENGVFAWIIDPDGNKVELLEPKIWDDKNKR